MFPLFYFTNSQEFSVAADQNPGWRRHSLQHTTESSQFTMLLDNMCSPLIHKPNGDPTLGNNAVDHTTFA